MHIWTISGDALSRLRPSLLALAAACAGLASGTASAQAPYIGNFDLAISTRAVSDGCFAGDTCTIGVAITNFGPDAFDGAVRLRGRFQGRVRAVLTGIGPSGWTCNQASGNTVCTHRGGGIMPGRTLILETAYDLPTGLPVHDLTYCASIEWDGGQTGEPSVADIQRALTARGYNPGPVDGVPGFGTRNAIQQFQADNGLEITGWPTPEFNERLFGGAGYAGDDEPGNDRSCTSIADSGAPLEDRGAPDDELPPEDDDVPTEEEFAPSTDEDAGRPDDDAADPGRDDEPEEPARLPRVRAPAPAPGDHNKALSSFHETYRSGLHDKVLSQAHADDETPDAAPRTPDAAPRTPRRRTPDATPRTPDPAPRAPGRRTPDPAPRTPEAAPRTPDPAPQAPDAIPQAPIHGKLTSEFHRKQLSTQHEKATSGAVVDSQPLDPVASDEPGDDDWKAEFHQKYKSVQHKKDSSTLQEVHTKAISRVVHSKARSVITNPQFQGETHEKSLSAFHKKFRSQSHDKATSQASVGQTQ